MYLEVYIHFTSNLVIKYFYFVIYYKKLSKSKSNQYHTLFLFRYLLYIKSIIFIFNSSRKDKLKKYKNYLGKKITFKKLLGILINK